MISLSDKVLRHIDFPAEMTAVTNYIGALVYVTQTSNTAHPQMRILIDITTNTSSHVTVPLKRVTDDTCLQVIIKDAIVGTYP